MDDTSAQRIGAGLSLLFAAGERSDGAALARALAQCQAQGEIVQEEAGSAQIVAGGLTFEVDGLAPAAPIGAAVPDDRYGFTSEAEFAGLVAVRLFPGAHLSGGVALEPVYRAMLAMGAELAVCLPVGAVHWHPAATVIAPEVFSRRVLAWLAGGTFPAQGLTALTTLSDGSVVSRGLAHFIGQEVTVRAPSEGDALVLAGQVVDHLVRSGPLRGFAELTFGGELFCAEAAPQARRVLVWPAR
jgi:hypothetical protein